MWSSVTTQESWKFPTQVVGTHFQTLSHWPVLVVHEKDQGRVGDWGEPHPG